MLFSRRAGGGSLGLFLLLAGLPSLSRAATYYVSPNGDDHADGSLQRPWRTPHEALKALASGDTLCFLPGRYVDSVDLQQLAAGVTDVILQAQQTGTVTIDGDGASFGIGSWQPVHGVRIMGFTVTHALMGIGFYRGGENLEVEDCDISHCEEGLPVRAGTDVTIRHVYVHDNHRSILLGVKDQSGVTNVLVEDCTMTDNRFPDHPGNTDGIAVEGMCQHVLIRRCTASGHGDAGFDVKPSDTVLESCVAYDNHGLGFKLWGKADRLVNCLAYHNQEGGLGAIGEGLQAWNCTLADNSGKGVRLETPQPITALCHNCIFANNVVRVEGPGFYDDDYNLYYAPAEEAVIRSSTRAYAMKDLRPGKMPLGAHSLLVDPGFVAPEAGDYSLRPDSPARKAGLWNDLLRPLNLPDPPDLGARLAGA